jgi:hypothetical protein
VQWHLEGVVDGRRLEVVRNCRCQGQAGEECSEGCEELHDDGGVGVGRGRNVGLTGCAVERC